MAGTRDGVLNHTVSGTDWHNLWFNGTRVGETGINAALCGNWGCPVLLVTGDDAVCREAKELLGDGLTAVSVKQGLGRRSARMLVPSRARELIEEGAKKALSDLKAVAPYDPGKPCEVKVEYKSTGSPQKLRFQPGVEIIDDRTIVSRADDWWSAWKQFFFVETTSGARRGSPRTSASSVARRRRGRRARAKSRAPSQAARATLRATCSPA